MCGGCVLSHAQLFVTLWTVASQVPQSPEFSRQEYWSGLPFPPPGDLPRPGTEPLSLAFPALASRFFTTAPPGKPINFYKWFSMMLLSLSRNRPKIGKIYGERASQAWPRPKVLVREVPFSRRETPSGPCGPNRELHREEIKLASFAVAWIMSPSWHKEKSLRVLEVWLGKLFQTQVQPWLQHLLVEKCWALICVIYNLFICK